MFRYVHGSNSAPMLAFHEKLLCNDRNLALCRTKVHICDWTDQEARREAIWVGVQRRHAKPGMTTTLETGDDDYHHRKPVCHCKGLLSRAGKPESVS